MSQFDLNELQFGEGMKHLIVSAVSSLTTKIILSPSEGVEVEINVRNLPGYVEDGKIVGEIAEAVGGEQTELPMVFAAVPAEPEDEDGPAPATPGVH